MRRSEFQKNRQADLIMGLRSPRLLAAVVVALVGLPLQAQASEMIAESEGEPADEAIANQPLLAPSDQASVPTAEELENEPAAEAELPIDVSAHPTFQPSTSQAATTVEEWVAQIEASLVQIIDVRVEETAAGLQVVLTTAEGELATPTTQTVGNALIADIPNAVLALPSDDSFEQFSPAEGIALVSVTNEPGDQVRVAITGTDAPPVAEINATGLAVTLGEAIVSAEEDAIQVVVTGEEDEGYNSSNATTATRTDTPLRDIPQSIQVIPQQVLEDQRIERLGDALQNVSGVLQAGNYNGTPAGGFIIRGFNQSGNFRNGLRDNGFFSFPDFANIERVEVLKGPASILFGQVEPGGIVNIVTKQPLSEPYYSVDFAVGNYSYYRPSFDISGPLNAERTVLYRLNVAYQNSESFRDFVDTERIVIAPALTWEIGDNTTLDLDFEYIHNDSPVDRGLTVLSDNSLALPINTNYSYPSLDTSRQDFYRGGYRFEHRFTDTWRIRNNFFVSFFDRRGDAVYEDGDLIDDRFIPRGFYDEQNIGQNYSVQTDLIGDFNTGSIAHQLLLGFDFNRNTDFYNFRFARLPNNDIFNPVNDVPRPTDLSNPESFSSRIDTWGIYLQDQITLLDNLKLLTGGRFDLSTQNNLNTPRSEQFSDAFSPRVGIVYQPIPPISLYASYSTSFVPAIGRSVSNDLFEPTEGRQFEVGVRGELLDGRLSANLAAFDITKSNVLTDDLDNPGFSIQVGEQRSQGIELDVIGEILPGWNIIATYAYTDARVTEDNRIPTGNRLNNSAQHIASLWTTYQIQNGGLQGLGGGLGFFFVGNRPGDDLNTFELPSYFRTDATIFYEHDQWRAALNIRNLFDIEYYENSTLGRIGVYPGAPFTIIGSLKYEF